MLNVMIGKSGRPVVTGGSMFGYGISNITENSRRSKIKLDSDTFSSFDNAVNHLVDDGMTPMQAFKYAKEKAVI